MLTTLNNMAGLTPPIIAPAGVEITRRRTSGKTWTYILNHTPTPQTLTLAGTDALTNTPVTGPQTLAPYAVPSPNHLSNGLRTGNRSPHLP